MRLHSPVGVLGLAILAAPAGGQTVVPGLTLRADRRPALDTVVYRRTTTRDGHDSSTGTRTVALRVIDSAGSTPLLEVVQRFPGGGGEIVDTAIADFATLHAVAHRSHQPTRTMRFDFVGNDAVGTVAAHTAAGDTTAPVRQSLGGPIFDSNVIDLVVAALPLREGFTAELPFFFFERGGRVPMAVAVRERATVAFAEHGQREVWVVTVGVPGAPATVWVDTRTRAVLRIRYDIAARGLSFTDERATPLRS
jgi:hypothetical protein